MFRDTVRCGVPDSAPVADLANPPDDPFRDHSPDKAEDELLERWTKLGAAVLAHGAPTQVYISERTELARAEQNQIKRKLRRTAKVFRQKQSKAA